MLGGEPPTPGHGIGVGGRGRGGRSLWGPRAQRSRQSDGGAWWFCFKSVKWREEGLLFIDSILILPPNHTGTSNAVAQTQEMESP